MRSRAILWILLLITMVTVGCRTAPIYNVTRSNVPPGLSAKQVGDIITYAATRRGWSLETIGPGQFVASINVKGRHRAAVDIKFDAEAFSITYRESENLKYDGEKIHRNYNGWVIKLEKTIRKELLRAAGRPVSDLSTPSADSVSVA